MATHLDKLGQRIKTLRQAKGLTLKDMVEYTGLSLGYLSNLERNLNSPTIAALNSICIILGVEISDILKEYPEKKILITADEREPLSYPNQLMSGETIQFSQMNFIIKFLTIEPGVPDEAPFWRHNYNEVCLIISGELEVILEDETYLLHTGDSLAIDANLRHALRNPGNRPCLSQWIHNTSHYE